MPDDDYRNRFFFPTLQLTIDSYVTALQIGCMFQTNLLYFQRKHCLVIQFSQLTMISVNIQKNLEDDIVKEALKTVSTLGQIKKNTCV